MSLPFPFLLFLTSCTLTYALLLPLSTPKGWNKSVAKGISLSQQEPACQHPPRTSDPGQMWVCSICKVLGFVVLSLHPIGADTNSAGPGWLHEQPAAVPWCLWACYRAHCNLSHLTSSPVSKKPADDTRHFLPFKP